MRRRTLFVALAGLAVVVAAGVVALWPPPDRITPEKLARLQTGMSRADVEQVIGAPGNYSTSPLVVSGGAVFDLSQIRGTVSDDRLCWITDTVIVEVQLDEHGRVTSVGSVPCTPSRRLFDDLIWLIWRAKRQWHRWFRE
jgi:hypothetical protein